MPKIRGTASSEKLRDVASEPLFRRLPDPVARDELVRRHRPLSLAVAHRFAGRGEDREDLEQVAAIGLIKALDRFDPDKGVRFSTYATTTMTGEVKRYFRDHAWMIRVPRGAKEAALRVRQLSEEVSQTLGHTPSTDELADHSDMSLRQIGDGMEALDVFAWATLEPPSDDGEPTVREIGDDQAEMANVDDWLELQRHLVGLSRRDRRILMLRYLEDRTQEEIAERVGLSQMQVSRILKRVVGELQRRVGVDGAKAPARPA